MKTFTKTLFLLVLMIMSSTGAWASVAEVWFHGAKQGSYDAFYKAIEAANNLGTDVNNRATVKLLCDATASQHQNLQDTDDDAYVYSGKYIIFDGNGHTLTITTTIFNVYGSLTVTGGTIQGTVDVYDANAGCTLNVTGGTINGNIVVSNGTANISGGTVNGKISITTAAGNVGTLNVTGGTINGGSNTGGAINATEGYINISGGEIIGADYAVKSENTNSGAVSLSGGTIYKGSVGALYMSTAVSNALTEGNSFYVQDSNNKWVKYTPASEETKIDQTVKIDYTAARVAEVNGTKYISFAEALTAAQNAGTATVKLLDDVDYTETGETNISAGKVVTFDLNGKTLTMHGMLSINGTLIVSNGTLRPNSGYSGKDEFIKVYGGLTVESTATIGCGTSEYVYSTNAIGAQNGCEININGGNILGGNDGANSYYAINASSLNTSGKITLKGGTYFGNKGAILLPFGWAVSSILGSGKIFYKENGTDIYDGDFSARTISDTKIKVADIQSITFKAGTNGYTAYSKNFGYTFSGAKAYKAAAPSNNSVTMTEVTGIIPANAGVIFKADAANADITITPNLATSTADMTGNKLVAVKSSDTSWATGTNYVLMSKGTDTKFFATDGSASTLTALAGKCYLNVPTGEARSLDIDWGGGETTGVSQLSTLSSQPKDGKYIENGRIVIMKNGMKYNTAGQRVF